MEKGCTLLLNTKRINWYFVYTKLWVVISTNYQGHMILFYDNFKNSFRSQKLFIPGLTIHIVY